MALSKALPDKAVACWGRHRGHYVFGSDPRTGERYVQTTFDSDGGAGAVRGYDGYEGAATFPTLGSVNRGNVEELEIRFPWRIRHYEFATDLEGAGRWRGACGMHWEAENRGGEAGMASGSSDGDHTQPPGAAGGDPGPLCQAFLQHDGQTSPLQSHRMYQVQTGDLLIKLGGGGAGVGDPKERVPERVRRDVRNGMVSLERARQVYGVALDPLTLAVDEQATASLRREVQGPV
jgi:N-methylhydantoinase B